MQQLFVMNVQRNQVFMSPTLNQYSPLDITHTQEFQSVDAMVSAYDAEGEGPLRKGEAAFNWGAVEALCLPLAQTTADLRLGIWLLRVALASLQVSKVLESLERIAQWTRLSSDQLHPLPAGEGDEIHALILGWLASPAFIYALGQLKVNACSELSIAVLEAQAQIPGDLQEAEKLALAQQLRQMMAALAAIEKHMLCGHSAQGRSLIRASQLLERCLKKVAQHEDVPAAQTADPGDAPAPQASGNLNSRSDVSAMLTRIIAYFQTHEPSHPAPIFLNRVQRMLGANFEELMDELYPDARQLIAKIERPKVS